MLAADDFKFRQPVFRCPPGHAGFEKADTQGLVVRAGELSQAFLIKLRETQPEVHSHHLAALTEKQQRQMSAESAKP